MCGFSVRAFLIFTTLVSGESHLAASAQSETASLGQDSPGCAVRMACDIARFNPLEIDGRNGDGWAVLQITPDRCGYTERVDLAMSEDGQAFPVPPPASLERSIVGGTVHLISVLSGNPGCVERFEEVTIGGANAPDPGVSEKFYSPFEHGGTLVCRVNNGFPGRYRFCPAILIPSEWASQVEPAIHFVRQNSQLFDPANLQRARPRLESLLKDPNPLLSAAAARLLAAVGGSDDAIERQLAMTRDPVLQSVFVRVLVFGGPTTASTDRVRAICKLVGLRTSQRSFGRLLSGHWRPQRDVSLGTDHGIR